MCRAGTHAGHTRAYDRDKGGAEPAISRVLSRAAIPLGRTSPSASSGLPGDHAGHVFVPLFGLAPGGVCRATDVATGAVRSYRTLSPLPPDPSDRGRRSALCCTFRRLTPPRRYLAPCPVEPGLSSNARFRAAAAAWPTPQGIIPVERRSAERNDRSRTGDVPARGQRVSVGLVALALFQRRAVGDLAGLTGEAGGNGGGARRGQFGQQRVEHRCQIGAAL